ncbi:hypothetical protein [Planctomyces sp. SH-PL14]|uniref:hypothetical protein n=1 Tax=Planctomyces sp. SH-PL14 TaxID=1632864 RepID=UPI00078D0DFD|nr:hypothetical protein [Planctomyces sp. SH-PL14]AMV20148.1 hypothetical protein VT03_19790 [Planctomyces sp. SH-PL14]
MRLLSFASFATASLAAGVLAFQALHGAAAQDAPRPSPSRPGFERTKELQQFMRKKLDASNRILEGLVTEDSRLVKSGADELAKMCEAETWRISKDVMYRQFSDDFQRVTKLLGESAQAGDLDKAMVRWVDVTMQCVDCHRFVRDKLIAEGKPSTATQSRK